MYELVMIDSKHENQNQKQELYITVYVVNLMSLRIRNGTLELSLTVFY